MSPRAKDDMNDPQNILRHFLASIAYRFQAVVKEVPPNFGNFDARQGIRTPSEIVRHMTHVLMYARCCFSTKVITSSPFPLAFEEEVLRFHETLEKLDRDLIKPRAEKNSHLFNNLVQGPFSDVMTHIGQIALLRRMAGSPVRGQNFWVADIEIGRVGTDQNKPVEYISE